MVKKISSLIPTSKKQKILKGVEYFINKDTGEEIPFVVQSVEDRDFNFHKVWLRNVVTAFQEITNKKMVLAFWIIEHLNKENQLVMPIRQIAEETGISHKTVGMTISALQKGECPFLVKVQSGVYMVNPDVIYKGSHSNRMGILYDYSKSVTGKSKTEH